MKFRLFILTITALLTFSIVASAQDEINRIETFVGYSHSRFDWGISSNDSDIDDIFSGREGANGANLSITGNVSRYIGIKGDVAFHGKTFSDTFGTNTLGVKYRNTTLMGGVQFKNNLKDGPTVKPFAHVLAGLAHQKFTTVGFEEDTDGTDNSFTMAIGGGLDVRVHKNVDIRVIQFDYTPIFRGNDTIVVDDTPPPTTVTFGRQNNFRIGFGIVFH